MITPYPHQIEFADRMFEVLKTLGYVYLAGKPRSGKTYTSILCAEKSNKINSVLVLTKKAAISGWEKFIVGNTELKHKYRVTNYEQVNKLTKDNYDLVIIDESHNLGTLAKPSNRILNIRRLCWDLPHIHLSGTAIVESQCGIYHQMAISKYNPFRAYRNFYDFHRFFGEPYYIKAAGRDITMYDKANERLMPEINAFTIYMTQEDAGISKDLQSVDKLHYVTLLPETKALYNIIQEHNFLDLNLYLNKNYKLVCDSTMKLRTSLHMLESGILKIDNNYIEVGNTEKIDYIYNTFGDTEDTGIMCHFIGERKLLEKRFKLAKIYSSSAHAEGVNLSHLTNFIILSSDYSGSKFIQRRDRIIDINGSNTLTVHHILVKGAISEQVYKKVSKKEDFNNKTYIKQSI